MKNRFIYLYILVLGLVSCRDDDEKRNLLPSELVTTSLDFEWQKIETSITGDNQFFVIKVGHFGIPWGSSEPSKGPDYCMGTCDRNQLYFYIEQSKLQPNTIIELSNGIPQSNHKGPPPVGSYMQYDFFIDDPPSGQYFYTVGTISIADIKDEKIYGSFTISDPFATYLPETITGEFHGVPYYPTIITLD